MAQRSILIIDGHPDPDPAHFVHALALAYAKGAAAHDVKSLRIADLDFPVLSNPKEWMEQEPPASIVAVQKQIKSAEHLVILYPLWLGDMPALLKAFLEQTLRPEFAFRYGSGMMPEKLLTGRSARLIVTMGMPSLAYDRKRAGKSGPRGSVAGFRSFATKSFPVSTSLSPFGVLPSPPETCHSFVSPNGRAGADFGRSGYGRRSLANRLCLFVPPIPFIESVSVEEMGLTSNLFHPVRGQIPGEGHVGSP